MTFTSDLNAFIEKVGENARAAFLGVVAEAERSIKDGSEITGAPGQPVQSGDLKRSWATHFPEPNAAVISTSLAYAPGIEDGINLKTGAALTLRSPVGGFHSVKTTEAGFQRMLDHVAEAFKDD